MRTGIVRHKIKNMSRLSAKESYKAGLFYHYFTKTKNFKRLEEKLNHFGFTCAFRVQLLKVAGFM